MKQILRFWHFAGWFGPFGQVRAHEYLVLLRFILIFIQFKLKPFDNLASCGVLSQMKPGDALMAIHALQVSLVSIPG